MAQEINDLFHTSPIEDLVWEELKAAEIQAERRDRDRRRNTYLTTRGWLVQRFGTDEIHNDIRGCIDQIRRLINQHGGPVDRSLAYDLYRTDTDSQLDLFEITD